MKDLLQYCQELSPLSDLAQTDLNAIIKVKSVRKGEILLEEGDVCSYLYFINEGLAKVFSFSGDKEFIMRFFSESQIFSVFDSFLTKTPSKFTIIALEDSLVSMINYDDMESISQKHHAMETFFRKVTSHTTIRMTKRIHEMLEEDTTRRYQNFMDENKHIAQRISLGDVARYLGITQPSLSRIRSQNK
jgi:CRP-like cAMP-binding protein